MIRRPPRSTQSRSSAASDVYKRQCTAYRITRCIFLIQSVGHRDDHHPSVLVRDVYGASIWRYQEVRVTLAGNEACCPDRLVYLARHAIHDSQAVIGAENEEATLVRSDLNLVAPGVEAD